MSKKAELLSLRKEILNDEFSFLNPPQREAVFSNDGPLLILAGAGSGKTTTVISKIGYLIRYGNAYNSQEIDFTDDDGEFLKECLANKKMRDGERYFRLMSPSPVDAYNILAITFTNKAAGEMRERLEKQYGIDSGKLWALTFHSFCVRILRRFCDRLGYNRNFTIYDDTDSHRVIESLIKKYRLTERYNAKTVARIISTAKSRNTSADEYSGENDIEKIYRDYQAELKAANAFDFDDLIFMTVRLLSLDEDVKTIVNNRFRYILVDEYQDTNPIQERLISLLAPSGRICVVGDDDQSIYKFRGATIENILNFEDDYSDALIIRLEQNYRSTKNILDAANSIIKHNRTRREKTLWTDNVSGDKIKVYEAANGEDEARFVASTVSKLVASQNKKYSDFAVLYRMNAQSFLVERALSQNGIPYRLIGGVRFYERAEIKDIVAYLQLIENTSDDLRLKRIINVPKRGIGQTTVDTLEAAATSAGISMFEAITRAQEIPVLSGLAKKLSVFSDMINELITLKEKMPLNDFVIMVMGRTGILGELEAQKNEEGRQRIENLKALVSNTVEYMRSHPDDASLRGFLEEIALYTDLDSQDNSADSVTMLTIHSAKGLEFDTVFLVGTDEGIFPSSRSFDFPEEIEEERRLCYVAVTRAKRQLYITRARERLVFGKTMYPRPSRFLEEIADEYKEPAVSRRASKTRTASSYGDRSKSHYSSGQSSMFKNSSSRSAPAPQSGFIVGERVRHRKFGEGMIISMKPMGNDIYLEVAFDSVGTKKLMANLAGLKKI